LIVEDNAPYRRLLKQALNADGYLVIDVDDARAALEAIGKQQVDVMLADVVLPGMDGIELIDRAREVQPGLQSIVMTGHGANETVIAALRSKACDFLSKPFAMDELRAAVRNALSHPATCEIQVVSAKPDWIEIRVPCDLSAVEPVQNFITELDCNLPREVRQAIGEAFREMLINAIEHGGKCDPSNLVEVKWVRLKRAILYSIKDPGEGFDMRRVPHAAFANPEDDPYRHLKVREKQGLRPGGFGIMLARQAIDELIYNEKHNELILVKYID
jgi:DNA-binding response OmpR family regulator